MDIESDKFQSVTAFLQSCQELAQSRTQNTDMIMIPEIHDIEAAAELHNMTHLNSSEIRRVLIDTALPHKWANSIELYTGEPVCNRYDMKITVLENVEVYPVIELSEIHPDSSRPKKSWHRSDMQITTRSWQIELDHAHLINNGFAFIELNKPVDRQKAEKDSIIYVAQIVGFCVHPSKLVIESL